MTNRTRARSRGVAGFGLGAIALTFALAAGATTHAAATEAERLLIVPVFGADREDVSADVDFFATGVGPVASERRFGSNDALVGYNFSSRLRPDDDNVYPPAEGEIGVAMKFMHGDFQHIGMQTVPAPVDGVQRLEIELDAARVLLTIEGASDDDTLRIGYGSPNGPSYTVSAGGGNYGRRWYLTPGTISLSVERDGTSARDEITTTVMPGESVPVTLRLAP